MSAVLGAIVAVTVNCRQGPRDPGNPSEERNKALVRRWIDVGFNQRRLAVVDELFAEQLAVNGQVIGRDALKQNMNRHLTGFPDLQVTLDEIIAEGAKVGIWYTVEGTHQGEFESIPATGKHVKWAGFDLFTIEDGKIASARFLSDLHGLLIQLTAAVPKSRALRRIP